MEPKIWGGHVWKSMHYIALALPQNPSAEDKDKYYEFYMSLKHVLPCQKCSDHLKEVYEKYPLKLSAMESASDLFEWTVKIHNEVNKKLKKPIMELSEATKLYSNSSPIVDDKNCKSYMPIEKPFLMAHIFIICLLILIVILTLATRFKSNIFYKF